jgi:V8-like Glu-specific endopeptidase
MTRRSLAWTARVVAIFAGAACAETEAPPPLSRPIVGGTIDTGDPSVVGFDYYSSGGVWYGSVCTGTIISPRVALTAAHCIDAAEEGGVAVPHVVFGWDAHAPTEAIAVVGMRRHRLYATYRDDDIALLQLATPASTAPIPVPELPLEGRAQAGQDVRFVGYGITEANTSDGIGIKRQVTVPLESITYKHIIAGEDGKTTCSGDSGGPAFLTLDGQEVVAGVTSWGRTCTGNSFEVRTDIYWDDFLRPGIDAWDGPCAFDGACVTDGCRTPDPDCDPCGPNGTCADGCERPDWDCPIGPGFGAACADEYDCDSRVCVTAVDDARIQYCSRACDPAGTGIPCAVDTECLPFEGGSACLYQTPTPSAQGSRCVNATDCRSGLCHDDGYCIEPCAAEGAACPAGFECLASELAPFACEIPTPDPGGCRVTAPRGGDGGGRAGGWATLAGLAAAVACLFRRRRSRRASTRSRRSY